jgi:hypothetical protein
MASITQDRVLEALAALVPEETRAQVGKIVTSLLDEAVADQRSEYEAEYNKKLDEAYRIVAEERDKDWLVAEQGYKQAYDIIADLRARLGRQEEEFQETLTEEYEKAYQMILAERQKNDDLQNQLYEEFDGRTQAIKEYMIEMVDKFLGKMGEEYYEVARREVLNDPCLAEHRVAFERVLDVAKDYLSDEDIMLNTNTKVNELERQVETLEYSKRQVEAKNMRLMTENSRIHEYLKETKELIEGNILNEQNARLERASEVQGRGKTLTEPQREVVIGETVDSTVTKDSETVDDEPQTITEQWQVLAGLKESY